MSNKKYHSTYFQVSLGLIDNIEDKFIENNFDKLNDWWHVDQSQQFVDKKLIFKYAYQKAIKYINHPNLFARRWGYVMFMPTLVKDKENYKKLLNLIKDDNEYYVIMSEAWFISYLGIYYQEDTLNYLKIKPLRYNIEGKAIQKNCDSF